MNIVRPILAEAGSLSPAPMEATDHFWQAVLMQARSNNVSEVSRHLFLHDTLLLFGTQSS